MRSERFPNDVSLPARRAGTPAPCMVLTGFGPFPGVPTNASAELSRSIATQIQRTWPHANVIWAELPTEWQTGPRAAEQLVRTHRPDIILHFGVAREAMGIRLETLAENAVLRIADASGHVPHRSCINTRGPKALLSTFPVALIRNRLNELGIPNEVSDDAGKYLCNATLYRSLLVGRKLQRGAMTGFVHIPTDLGTDEPASHLHGLDWKRALMGGLIIAETCLSQVLEGIPLEG